MVLSPQLYEDPTVHWNRSLKSSLRGSRTGFPGQEGTGSSCLGVSRRWGLPRPGGSLEGSLEMVVLDPQLPGLVSDPEMEAKAGESPCAELAPAALALPWPEMGSPPAGDPSQEAEELFEQAPDQEEQAETDTEEEPESEPEPKSSSRAKRTAIGAAVGIGVAVLGAPVAIWAAGFTGAGIAAGSIAAKMMSAAAIANGGGVAAGSLVATLQSAGAAGLSLGANIGLGTALGSVGAAVGSWFSKK